jgi:hypothetical protein
LTPSVVAAALAAFCAAVSATTGQAQQSWAQSYGVRSYDENGAATTSASYGSGYDVAKGIARMPDGGFVVAGQLDLPEFYFRSHLQNSGFVSGATLVRYAPDGTILWQQLLRQENDVAPPTGGYFRAVSRVWKVVTDAQGNIFISGGKGNQGNQSFAPYVAKFDASGALIWQRSISGPTIDARTEFRAALTRDGGVLLTSMEFTCNGCADPALAKLNSDGSVAFYAAYDQSHIQYLDTAGVVESATEDNVYVALVGDISGLTLLRIDGSGNLLGLRSTRDSQPSRQELQMAIVPTADGGFATLSRVGTYVGAVLRKFDHNLVPIFEKWIQPVGFGFVADSLVAETDGGFLIGGSSGARQAGGPEVFPGGGGYEAAIMRVSAVGDLQFVSVVGGPNNEGSGEQLQMGTYVLRAADGGYAMATTAMSYRADPFLGKPDWWTVKTNGNRRVGNFGGLLGDLPLSWFTVTDVPNTATGTRQFARIAATASTSPGTNFIIDNLANKTGINKPDVLFQGSSVPRIVSSNAAEAIVGQHFSYHIETEFVAPSATLTYSATNLPQNFRLNSSTGVISGAPRPGSETTEPIAITLQVSDGTNTIQFVLRLTISVGPPRFSVNGRNEPVYPGSAGPVTGLADQPLRFSANYGGRQAGQFVGVQVSTNPGDAASWQPLGNATGGFMIFDAASDSYVVNSTAYPQAPAVYFRANVKTNGRADSASNVVGPFDLASTAQRLDKTSLYITRNGPVANIRFGVTQLNPPSGLEVRLQSTTTPSSETTWTTVSYLTVDPNDARQFYLDRDDYPVGDGVYFRVIATAPGYVQSISGPQGPFTFIHDPAAQVTITIPDSGGSGGTSFDNPLTPNSNSFTVMASATGAGRQLSSLNLLYDGDRIDRFIGGTTNGSTQYNTSVAGHHLIEAVAIDDLGVTGHARPVHVHVRPSGGKIYRRTSSGVWADPAAWLDEQGGHAIPGENDFAVLSGFDVSVANAVTLRAFSLNGGKITGAGKITVTGFATLGGGSIRNDMEIAQGATLLLINDQNVQLGGTIVNRGRTKFHGRGGIIGVQDPAGADRGDGESPEIFGGIKALFVNLGNMIVQAVAGGRGQTAPPPRTPEVRPIVVQQVQNQGVIAATAPDGSSMPPAVVAPPVSSNGSGLVDANGNPIVSGGAGNIVSGGAGNIVAGGAGNIVSGGAGNIVAVGAGNIVAGGAGNIVAGGAGNRPSSVASKSAGADGTTPTPGFVQTAGATNLTGLAITAVTQLNGGALSGSGVILGDVTNDGALIGPGNSPGSIAVIGGFSQNTGGTLRIEAEGGEAHQFDQLQVGGTAALGGTLDLRMIGGYLPLPEDAFNPIGYATVTGAFDSVTSNAQVTLTPTGILVELSPTPPALIATSAFSRKTHGSSGDFNVPLSLGPIPSVECRNGSGNHMIVFTFSNDVVSGGATVTSGVGSVSGTPTISGNTMTVLLTGVANAQRVTVSATNVTDQWSQVLADSAVTIGFLVGDTSGNGSVNTTDIGQTKAQSGQGVTTSNFRTDVTANGGAISSSDIGLVKSAAGTQLP